MVPRAARVDGVDAVAAEKLLEDILAHSPEVLMEGLTIIGRQNETAGGPLDLLGLDDDGKLVVFELKRGELTRDAVAQVLDYASWLAALESDGERVVVRLHHERDDGALRPSPHGHRPQIGERRLEHRPQPPAARDRGRI